MDQNFYGGRKGDSFILSGRFEHLYPEDYREWEIDFLKKKFETEGITEKIDEKILEWKKEHSIVPHFKDKNYLAVNFDEYAIIDSINKNDPDNGKIYKRGYDYSSENGDAQYIGQIVGPSGLAPQIELSTIDEIKKIAEKEGYEYRRSEGEYAPFTNLIPGKTETEFNDTIQWACCSVRDKNNKDTIAYVGFKFPYTVIEYTADSVDPYYHRSNDTAKFINENLVDREDKGEHPFFEKWHISVPKGIKGDAFKNLRIISASPEDNIINYTGQDNDRSGKKKVTFDKEDATRKIVVYDYYHYDKDGSGEPTSIYLGDYNMISDIAIDEDGTVRIAYSHDDDHIWKNKFKWIKDISITQSGIFTINYNYGGEETKYQTTLAWIDNVNFTDDGTVTFIYNDGITPSKEFPNKIKWITQVILGEDGTLTFSYNNGDKDTVFSKAVKWIANVEFDKEGTLKVSYNNGTPTSIWEHYVKWITDIKIEDNGTITVSYNNKTKDSKWENIIKWIKGVNLTENGTLTISYNNGSPNTDFPKMIKWISDILLDTQGTMTVQYNNEDPDKIFQNRIQWIDDTTLTDDGTLTVHYNNGAKDSQWLNKIKWITNTALADDGTFTVNYNNKTGPDQWANKLKWIKDILLDDYGTLTIQYNNNTPDSVWSNQIKWITGADVLADGTIQIHYNNNTPDAVFANQMKWITNIDIATDGTIQIDYNYGDPSIWDKKIRWVTGTSLEDNGDFTMSFNDGTVIKKTFRWITDCTFTPEGDFTLTFNDKTSVSQHVTWIKNCTFTPEGDFTLTFNDSTPAISQNIKWIKDLSFNNEGLFTIKYNNNKNEVPDLSKQIDWIKDIFISDEGKLKIDFNNPEKASVIKQLDWIKNVSFTDEGDFKVDFNNPEKASIQKKIKWLKNVSVNTGAEEGEGNQKLHLLYNDNTEEDIGNPLNYIIKTAIDEDNKHLLVLYSDPAKRGTTFYDGRSDWVDLGWIKREDGILIGKHIDTLKENLHSKEEIINFLNINYPNGIIDSTGAKIEGKIVSAGEEQQNKAFYGFDYNLNKWYFLGTFEQKQLPTTIVAPGPTPPEVKQYPTGTIWMILEP